jgi:nucleoid DNA-binding protein
MNERRIHNNQKRNDITLRARRIVTFKCSQMLKEKINGI